MSQTAAPAVLGHGGAPSTPVTLSSSSECATHTCFAEFEQAQSADPMGPVGQPGSCGSSDGSGGGGEFLGHVDPAQPVFRRDKAEQ